LASHARPNSRDSCIRLSARRGYCHKTRVFGVLPVERFCERQRRARAWVIRYLLTPPCAPDATLCNRDLNWTVSDAGTLRVSGSCQDAYAEVILRLNADGRIGSADALDITRRDDLSVEDAWRARFSAYRSDEGQMVPSSCEYVRRSRIRGLQEYQINHGQARELIRSVETANQLDSLSMLIARGENGCVSVPPCLRFFWDWS
jgi:hypothetical protein